MSTTFLNHYAIEKVCNCSATDRGRQVEPGVTLGNVVPIRAASCRCVILEDTVTFTKRKAAFAGLAAIGASALVLTGCAAAPTDEGDGGPSTDFLACMVSDSGGFDDNSFNELGLTGLEAASEEIGGQTNSVESASEDDFAPNIEAQIGEGCNLIVTVGFLLSAATNEAAAANPDVEFAIVDDGLDADGDGAPDVDNGKPILFDTAQAAYLAGYAAAATSTTGKVATFGGIQIPSVTIFMDGFADGIAKFNEDNGGSVQLLGWDKATQQGVFAGNFDSQDDGKNIGQSFIDQGADIIMPVAGPVGLGTASVAQTAGNVSIIGVDADWFETTEYGPIVLTSVMKEIGPAVFDTISEAVDGNFSSDPYVGTLENEGLGLAPFHDFESKIPADLSGKLDELKASIIAGDITVESDASPK